MQEDLQKELKEGKLGKTVKELEKQKQNYERAVGNIKNMTEEINGFVKKFDDLKEEIENFNKKQATFQMEKESKLA